MEVLRYSILGKQGSDLNLESIEGDNEEPQNLCYVSPLQAALFTISNLRFNDMVIYSHGLGTFSSGT